MSTLNPGVHDIYATGMSGGDRSPWTLSLDWRECLGLNSVGPNRLPNN